MRRKDREVKDKNTIAEIINECDCCRLGFVDEDEAYIVPMNFAYEINEDGIVLYFHSASEGRKIPLLKRGGIVAFEMDTGHSLVKGGRGCDYSYLYKCVMGKGRTEIIEEKCEKTEALKKIMHRYSGKKEWEFDDNVLNATTVFKLKVECISGKVH